MDCDGPDDRLRGKKSVLRIPSYPRTSGPEDQRDDGSSSGSSFSQAFSFIKSSDFYSPPPQTAEHDLRRVSKNFCRGLLCILCSGNLELLFSLVA